MNNTMCVFGDSLTRGVVYNNETQKYSLTDNNFVKLICDELNIKAVNFSKFGCTVGKGQELVKKNIRGFNDSDVALLEFGGNDCDFDWAKIAENPKRVHIPKTPLEVFANCYESMIETIKMAGVQPVLLNLPPLDAQKFFNWISRGLNAVNILEWLGGSVEYIYRWHEMYNMTICSIANKLKIPMIDIRSAFLKKGDFGDTLLCKDGMHPNESGHREIFAAVGASIRSLFNTTRIEFAI